METEKSGQPIVFQVYGICTKSAYFFQLILAQQCELADALEVIFLDRFIVILLPIFILIFLLFHV
jgi:hypothetical protein